MSNNKLAKLIGKAIKTVEPILDNKGKPTSQAFLVFSNNYKLKVKISH